MTKDQSATVEAKLRQLMERVEEIITQIARATIADTVALVCSADGASHGVRLAIAREIDITTSGYTDQRCGICDAQMIILQ